jgi:integrase
VATDEELVRLCEHFRQSTRADIPMADIVMFAIYSARRQDEITQLRWEDNDPEKLTGIVPRLKDPGGARIDVPFRYTLEAWEIVRRQPKVEGEPRIFPYNAKSIGAAFTRACRVLGIEDLRFHDLRHTAVTRLFRRGYQVHEVPAFSLHRSWATLKRYTNITPDQVELR